MLGNLRQEIEIERIMIKCRLQQGDPFRVFNIRNFKSKDYRHRSATLLEATIKELWQEFKNLERPFLIHNAFRAQEVRRGDYWGESDIDEKPSARDRRRKDRPDAGEAGSSPDQSNYYRTDFAHRFIWWQSRSDVISLMDQVQRIQIRRIERDVFEADELVRRSIRILQSRDDRGSSSEDGSSDNRGPKGNGPRRQRRRSGRKSSVGSVKRKASVVDGLQDVEIDEQEVIRRSTRTTSPGRRPGSARRSQPRYDYEVVSPGRIYVDVDDARPRRVSTYSMRDRD